MKIMILEKNKQRDVWQCSGYLLFPSYTFPLNLLKPRLIHWLPWGWAHSGLYGKNSNKIGTEPDLPAQGTSKVFQALCCQGSSRSLRVCSNSTLVQSTRIFCFSVIWCILVSLLIPKDRATEDAWFLVKVLTYNKRYLFC